MNGTTANESAGTTRRSAKKKAGTKKKSPPQKKNRRKEVKKKAGEGQGESPGKGTASELKKSASEQVRLNSDRLATSILQRALNGNFNFTKLLIALAEEGEVAENGEATQPRESLAALWGAEPAWIGELSEANAEVARGSREPEV